MISQKLTLLCKSITAQKTDFLSSPSTSTRGAAFLSCHSPSQPHGPAGCIWGAYLQTDRTLYAPVFHHPQPVLPSAHPHHQRPTPSTQRLAVAPFPWGFAHCPPAGPVSPLVQKIIGRIATSQAHFSTTRAEQSINHSRRPFRLPPSFSYQVVKSSSARPRRAQQRVPRATDDGTPSWTSLTSASPASASTHTLL